MMMQLYKTLSTLLLSVFIAACQTSPLNTTSDSTRRLTQMAAAGNLHAQLQLAAELEVGAYKADGIESALNWYMKAAVKGSAEGAYHASRLLQQKGPSSVDEARVLLKAAAKGGHAQAQLELADSVLSLDPESSANQQEAFQLYLSAAEQNLSAAQYKTASLLSRGHGVKRDISSALEWYRRSGEQGDAHAQLALGNFHLLGLGVPVNIEQALHWYEKSARQGSYHAQSHMGDLLTMESYGDTRDIESGARWYLASAEQNHPHAQMRLGMLHEEGSGVDLDTQQAARWYMAAAKQGNANAQCRLGSLYLRGSGLPQSSMDAERWFTKAAAQVPAGVLSLLGFIYYDCDQFYFQEIRLRLP